MCRERYDECENGIIGTTDSCSECEGYRACFSEKISANGNPEIPFEVIEDEFLNMEDDLIGG